MLGELIPRGGGDPIPLLQPKVLIGRRSSCQIVLGFPNVSSQHCELEFTNGYWRIRDLGSRNGIKVNGERCDLKWLLPGDEVSIAKNHYEIAYEPLADGPPPEDDDDPFALGLLEKAGLEKRRAEARQYRPAPAARSPRSESFDEDEDAAMEWLSDD